MYVLCLFVLLRLICAVAADAHRWVSSTPARWRPVASSSTAAPRSHSPSRWARMRSSRAGTSGCKVSQRAARCARQTRDRHCVRASSCARCSGVPGCQGTFKTFSTHAARCTCTCICTCSKCGHLTSCIFDYRHESWWKKEVDDPCKARVSTFSFTSLLSGAHGNAQHLNQRQGTPAV